MAPEPPREHDESTQQTEKRRTWRLPRPEQARDTHALTSRGRNADPARAARQGHSPIPTTAEQGNTVGARAQGTRDPRQTRTADGDPSGVDLRHRNISQFRRNERETPALFC